MRLTAALALCAACALAAGFAAAPAFAAVQPQSASLKGDGNDLGSLMGDMDKHLKALKRDVADAEKKEANAAHFAAIADLAEKCKAHVPDTAKTDDEKKLYAEQLDQVAAAAKAGAKAAAEGKADAAKKAVDDLKKLKIAGHKAFKND